jgi:hypothetical protein
MDGVAVIVSPGVCANELFELTRDMGCAAFLEGVDGGTGGREELGRSGARGRLTAIVSDASPDATGRFVAGGVEAAPLPVEGRSARGGSFRDAVLRANIRLIVWRARLGILIVTIIVFRLLTAGTSSYSSVRTFLNVLYPSRSSLDTSSDDFGDAFLLASRLSSASTSGGSVGESSAGNRTDDFRGLLLCCPSVTLLLAGLPTSQSSRRRFSAFRAASSRSLSMSRCRGDKRGGTEDFDVSGALPGVPRLFSKLPGRTPFMELPRSRGGGELCRPGAIAALSRLLPLGRAELPVELSLPRPASRVDDDS